MERTKNFNIKSNPLKNTSKRYFLFNHSCKHFKKLLGQYKNVNLLKTQSLLSMAVHAYKS
jgi:hypothetical protein